MFALVKFVFDDLYYVCGLSHVKTKKDGVKYAKYKNCGIFECELLATNANKDHLVSIRNSLAAGLPILELMKFVQSSGENIASYENSSSCSQTEKSDDTSGNPLSEVESSANGFEVSRGSSGSYHEDTDDSVKDPLFEIESVATSSTVSENDSLDTDTEHSNIWNNPRNIENSADIQQNTSFVVDSYTNEVECASVQNTDDILKQASVPAKPEAISSSKYCTKKNFCLYCKKLQTKLVRHLEMMHKNEEKVQNFLHLPKGNAIRRRMIETLRKEGNFLYNTNSDYNRGDRIVARRPNPDKQRCVTHYKICPNCKGAFSKLSLRKHYQHCKQNFGVKGERNILKMSRRIAGEIHESACETLRNDIFPVLRDDTVSQIIRYDELVIICGNKLCQKYKSEHHHDMIRQKLRHIGRFLVEIKKKCPEIHDFASVFQPKYFDNAVQAINAVAKLNDATYHAPSTANALVGLLRSSASTLISLLIRKQDHMNKKLVKDFEKLMNEEFPFLINRTAAETQAAQKRQKKIILPSDEDIAKLNEFLRERRRYCFKEIKEQGLSYENFLNLSKYTLSSVQVFNRRRAGEIERMLIKDFQNRQGLDKSEGINKEVLNKMSSKSQDAAKHYVRFTIRGKLGRDVPVLLHSELEKYINFIIDNRELVGVDENNPYVFGICGSGFKSQKYLRACNLMRVFSEQCGAANPNSLRGTHLRKHIATKSLLLNVQENQVEELCSHLGHDINIHKKIYRQSLLARDLGAMTLLLEKAQGDQDNDSEEDNLLEEAEHVEHGVVNASGSGRKRCSNSEFENAHNENQNISSPNCSSQSHRLSSPKRRSRASSDYVIKRRTWNEEERTAVKDLLKNCCEQGQTPSIDFCAKFVSDHPELHHRSPQHLKAWLSNNMLKKRRTGEMNTLKKRRVVVWDDAEKVAIRTVFSSYLSNFERLKKKLPSRAECRQAKEQFPELKNRSIDVIKAYINNEQRRIIRENKANS